MFHDLDATLRSILADAAAPADLRNAEVSFETPDKDFKPAQATMNLFLYEVQENRALRDNAPVRDRAGDHYVSQLPPLRMDCTYLVTTWSPKAGGLKAEEEHRLLGLVLLWLRRFAVIKNGYLQGSLKNPPQLYSPPTMVAQTKEGHGLGEFWSALGVAPRPALSLTVTITMQPFDQADQYPIVQAIQVDTVSLTDPALAGRVLDETLAPVPGAKVTVVETGQEVVSGPQGSFAFTGLSFGKYTLRVQALNQPAVQTSVNYSSNSQIHNVILPGH